MNQFCKSFECKCYDCEINKTRMKSYSIYGCFGCLYIFCDLVSDIYHYKKSLIFGCTTIHSIKDSRNKN